MRGVVRSTVNALKEDALSTMPVAQYPKSSRPIKQRGGCGPSCAYSNISGPSLDDKNEDSSNAAALLRHYQLDATLFSSSIRPAIKELRSDEETAYFLRVTCRPNWVVDFFAGLLRRYLRWSLTDVNALLGRGQMFVLSTEQAKDLLHINNRGGSLLDIGAGDGGVTARLSPLFSHVTCTEVSAPMCRRLKARSGVVNEVYKTDTLSASQGSPFNKDNSFDVVSILNVIDRCDNPSTLLRDACRLVKKETGRVLLAVVLPFSEFVEVNADRRSPLGPLPMKGARCADGVSLEVSLDALLNRVLLTHPLGGSAYKHDFVRPADSSEKFKIEIGDLSETQRLVTWRDNGGEAKEEEEDEEEEPFMVLERIARVPYLCSGDTSSGKRYFVLSDAIIVLRHATREEIATGVKVAIL
jgi:SAM-dependent methyltransferase